ncbi:hypothetical protein AVEN_218405-1 [Araneus ventricosus]|uniref:Uncharacterized protein n=1 Tax=Araneus ventricosus TaxID=182803 RepID=A0A4Y2WDI7_ARAVE|nr:hypothetical protein AVEN_218405-1 [Araneus ventricosus]
MQQKIDLLLNHGNRRISSQRFSLVILTPRFEVTRGLFWTGFVILYRGQMTMTTPELAPLLQTSTPYQREDVWPLRMIWRATVPIYNGSSVKSGLEPTALRPQSRDLTTSPPRPVS